ncbi:MAG: NAD(P)-dependent alcohol dehydrogenase [Deltaproteobacteria bacterium]|nr:NAD(P)-dependent alcohol dehydrogenase [Deltaproteobacteria bacterium]
MRALISLSGDNPLQWRDFALRSLGPHDLRVKVAAAGVNPVDWKMRDGDLLGVLQRLIGPSGPLVPGIDFAGEVEAVGAQVRDVAVGDRVVGGTDFSRGQHGSYATHVQVRQDQVAKVPDSVDLAQAACLPVAAGTAAIALFEVGKLRERASKKVLILGASGGVGHIAVQLARAAGATVFGVCSARNVKLVEELGATAVDYTQEGWQASIAAAGPWDVIVDGVGTASYPAPLCLGWLAKDGAHVMVVPKGLDFWRVVVPGRSHTVLTRATTERLQPLVAALADGSLRVVIQERVPLAEAQRAHELSRSGKVVGKVVLVA